MSKSLKKILKETLCVLVPVIGIVCALHYIINNPGLFLGWKILIGIVTLAVFINLIIYLFIKPNDVTVSLTPILGCGIGYGDFNYYEKEVMFLLPFIMIQFKYPKDRTGHRL
tara:strand:+ start:607 stop:942 length:336 start_codon:yes stop_codon:yes gene_type:complete